MRTVHRATLNNSAGELDYITADSLDTLTRQLGLRLVSKEWVLREGDTIIISSNEVK